MRNRNRWLAALAVVAVAAVVVGAVVVGAAREPHVAPPAPRTYRNVGSWRAGAEPVDHAAADAAEDRFEGLAYSPCARLVPETLTRVEGRIGTPLECAEVFRPSNPKTATEVAYVVRGPGGYAGLCREREPSSTNGVNSRGFLGEAGGPARGSCAERAELDAEVRQRVGPVRYCEALCSKISITDGPGFTAYLVEGERGLLLWENHNGGMSTATWSIYSEPVSR